jgi:hypothetical protein
VRCFNQGKAASVKSMPTLTNFNVLLTFHRPAQIGCRSIDPRREDLCGQKNQLRRCILAFLSDTNPTILTSNAIKSVAFGKDGQLCKWTLVLNVNHYPGRIDTRHRREYYAYRWICPWMRTRFVSRMTNFTGDKKCFDAGIGHSSLDTSFGTTAS